MNPFRYSAKGAVIGIGLLMLLASCGKGSYIPGKMTDTGVHDPPVQDSAGPDYWLMEEAIEGIPAIELYHFTQGEEGGRPVLLLHGGPAAPFAEAWPGLEGIEGYEFHYFHQRGSGNSTIPFDRFVSKNFGENVKLLDEVLGMARLIEDVERIRRILDEEQIILIGHSYGGFIAALYAMEFPEKVEKLILVEPADMLRFPPAHGGMDQIEDALTEEQKREYNAFMKEYFNYGKFFKKSEAEVAKLNAGYGTYYVQALENRYPGSTARLQTIGSGSVSRNGGFAGHAPFFSMGRKYDYRELLRRVEAPALILHGNRDLYGPETGKEYAAYLPNGVYNEFENSSHFPFYEEPDELKKIIEEFLSIGY